MRARFVWARSSKKFRDIAEVFPMKLPFMGGFSRKLPRLIDAVYSILYGSPIFQYITQNHSNDHPPFTYVLWIQTYASYAHKDPLTRRLDDHLKSPMSCDHGAWKVVPPPVMLVEFHPTVSIYLATKAQIFFSKVNFAPTEQLQNSGGSNDGSDFQRKTPYFMGASMKFSRDLPLKSIHWGWLIMEQPIKIGCFCIS